MYPKNHYSTICTLMEIAKQKDLESLFIYCKTKKGTMIRTSYHSDFSFENVAKAIEFYYKHYLETRRNNNIVGVFIHIEKYSKTTCYLFDLETIKTYIHGSKYLLS